MSAKEFATQLKIIIEDLKAKGIAAIYCENLIAYLNEVINSHAHVVSESELEKYKAELQAWVGQQRGIHTSRIEMFKSVIASGQNAIKSAFLLNGGAAVALLAFIGKLADSNKSLISEFAIPLIIFVAGVLIVSITSGFTYLSQWFYGGNKKWNVQSLFCIQRNCMIFGRCETTGDRGSATIS